MDHLQVPESYQSQVKVIPYLGRAPKYDRKGFDGFPERCGINVQDILGLFATLSNDSSAPQSNIFPSLEYVESFLQEWLWFGALHEFEKVCGLEMDPSQFIRPRETGEGRVLNTTPLLEYGRPVLIDRMQKNDVPLDLKVGEWVCERRSPEKGPSKVQKVLGNLRYTIEGAESKNVLASNLLRATEQSPQPCIDHSIPDLCEIPTAISPSMLRDSCDSKKAGESGPVQKVNDETTSPFLDRAVELVEMMTSSGQTILRPELELSIKILLSTLCVAFFYIEPSKELIQKPLSGKMLRKEMIEKNWCPSRISWLRRTSLETQYVASILPSHQTVSHRRCRLAACFYRPTSLTMLKPEHRHNICSGDCGELFFKAGDLIRILRCGGIPAIEEKHLLGRKAYKLVDVSSRDFVAISHVWSHGLGNYLANALPQCQISHLFELIRGVSPPNSLLWVDTMCVPIEPKYKRLALRKLRQVYRQASIVLVVDRGLLRVGTDLGKRRIQLRASEWMRRLWTLQEGQLASDLYIQFKDEAVSIAKLLRCPTFHQARWSKNLFNTLDLDCTRRLRSFFTVAHDEIQRFVDVVTELTYRSATVDTDEPICLATLLGLEIDDFKDDPTIADIYRSLPKLPQDLLFVSGQRLDIPGLKWAPASFMHGYIWESEEPYQPAILGDMGLHVRTDAIILDENVRLGIDSAAFWRLDVNCLGVEDFVVIGTKHRNLVNGSILEFANGAILLHRSGLDYTISTYGLLVRDFKEIAGVNVCRSWSYLLPLIVYRRNHLSDHQIATFEKTSPPHTKVLNGRYVKQLAVCVD